MYWSKRSTSVTSVEHDREWIDKSKHAYSNNQTILVKNEDQEYENAIKETGKKFDVVIIDGLRRVECARVVKEI